MKETKPSVNQIDIQEALAECDGTSCGFCKFCLDKKQDKFVDRNDGVRSYYPWRGTCYRYPPIVVTDKVGTPFFVRPKVYLTEFCGECTHI